MKAIYRNNIVQRMGGEHGFNFLVLTYCENIQDDESLDRFFGNFDLNTLTCLQKELLLVSFLEPYAETGPRKQRVLFRNDMMGLDRSIFPILEEHFVAALDDCFVTGLDYELCKAYFAELWPVFKECTTISKYRENVVERMGGEGTFDFLVVSYCERLLVDIKLRRFFESYDLHCMTHLQKDLILIVLLQPSVVNKTEALERRVISEFSPMFALGMNEQHFEMMERHFSAALFECLSRPPIIQTCLRLFSNLLSFFEEHAQSSVDYDDDSDEDEDDEEDETLIVRRKGVQSHIAKRISQALDASDRTEATDQFGSQDLRSLRSSESRSEVTATPATPNKKMEGQSDFCFASPLAASKNTKRLPSIGFTTPLATKNKTNGKPKMAFSWKSPTFKRMKRSSVRQ
ncbi:MAG: hypothetical protein SGBAC_011016 [Bacillariaceae sp.]